MATAEGGEKGQQMPEASEKATQGAPAGERTFTRPQMNANIGDRLARERAKYADYSELKQKAEAFDQAEELSKSELQKATERVFRQAFVDNYLTTYTQWRSTATRRSTTWTMSSWRSACDSRTQGCLPHQPLRTWG